MARVRDRRPENVGADAPGAFFVDSSCIDCGACRWIARESFASRGDQSAVVRQPETPAERERALAALVACPTASIGGGSAAEVRAAAASFPLPIAAGEQRVLYAGYHAESSFGAASYLIVRPPHADGRSRNVLVDSPRFARPLVERIEELGGIGTLFLTHRDDVADHARFAAHFGAERILHAAEGRRGFEDIERRPAGLEPLQLDGELAIVPVPGHTRGSACLLYENRYLFSGDHLAWSLEREDLTAFRDACWFDWSEQTRSMERLAGFAFEWVLPGHGAPGHAPQAEMARRMRALVQRMRAAG